MEFVVHNVAERRYSVKFVVNNVAETGYTIKFVGQINAEHRFAAHKVSKRRQAYILKFVVYQKVEER